MFDGERGPKIRVQRNWWERGGVSALHRRDNARLVKVGILRFQVVMGLELLALSPKSQYIPLYSI